LIDRYLITLTWGINLYPIPKNYNQTRLEFEFQIKQSPYTKRTLITKENIKLSSITDRYTATNQSVDRLSPSSATISTSHRHDLITTSELSHIPSFSHRHRPHRQFICKSATTFLPTDLLLINSRYVFKDTCHKTVSTHAPNFRV